jgi:hypothetical protein
MWMQDRYTNATIITALQEIIEMYHDASGTNMKVKLTAERKLDFACG